MKNWQVIVLIGLMLLIAVPFAVSYREYPMNRADTIAHIEATETKVWQYPAQMLSEIPVFLGKNNPNKAFLWFDIAMLLIAMMALYFVFSKLVSKWAGIMAVALAVFCSTGIATLWFAGAIFSFINVYILLPLGLYFLIRWVSQQRIYQGVLALLFLGTCSYIHTTGIYVPLVLFVFALALILSKRYRKQGVIVLGLMAVMACVVVSTIGIPQIQSYIGNPVASPIAVKEFLGHYLGITTAILLLAGVSMVLAMRKAIKIERTDKLVIIVLLSLVCVLIPLAFTSISRDPGRQVVDLVSVLAVLAACLLGIIVKSNKHPMLASVLPIVVLLGAMPMFRVWIMGGTTL